MFGLVVACLLWPELGGLLRIYLIVSHLHLNLDRYLFWLDDAETRVDENEASDWSMLERYPPEGEDWLQIVFFKNSFFISKI